MGTVEYEFERQDQYFNTSKFSFGYYIQPAIMATTKNMVTFLAIAFQLMVFSNALPQGLLGKLFNRRVDLIHAPEAQLTGARALKTSLNAALGPTSTVRERGNNKIPQPFSVRIDAPLDHLTGVRVSIQSLNAVTGHMSIAKKIETQPQ